MVEAENVVEVKVDENTSVTVKFSNKLNLEEGLGLVNKLQKLLKPFINEAFGGSVATTHTTPSGRVILPVEQQDFIKEQIKTDKTAKQIYEEFEQKFGAIDKYKVVQRVYHYKQEAKSKGASSNFSSAVSNSSTIAIDEREFLTKDQLHFIRSKADEGRHWKQIYSDYSQKYGVIDMEKIRRRVEAYRYAKRH